MEVLQVHQAPLLLLAVHGPRKCTATCRPTSTQCFRGQERRCPEVIIDHFSHANRPKYNYPLSPDMRYLFSINWLVDWYIWDRIQQVTYSLAYDLTICGSPSTFVCCNWSRTETWQGCLWCEIRNGISIYLWIADPNQLTSNCCWE